MPTIIRFGGGAGGGAQKLVVNVDSGAMVTARKGSVASPPAFARDRAEPGIERLSPGGSRGDERRRSQNERTGL